MAKMNVILVGTDGCGKTLYLAVLLKQQFVANQKNRWQLQPTNGGQLVFLNEVYSILTTRDQNFPQHTRRDKLTDYDFQVVVAGTDAPFTPLALSYLDYAGEITYRAQAGETVIDEFTQRVRNADVVIGLFDGQDVLELMESGETPPLWNLKYGALLKWLALNKNETRGPVHFIVTKWDLLADKYTLADVKARLLEFEHFEAFTQRATIARSYVPALHRNIEKVYPASFLIPMSTLGAGFAYLSGDTMVKTGETMVRPFDITIPLALAVCNNLWVRWSSANGEESADDTENTNQLTQTVKDTIATLAYVIEPVTPGPLDSLVRLGTVVYHWLHTHQNNSKLDVGWLRKRRELYKHGKIAITNESEAFEALINDLALQIAEFMVAYPEARLTGDRHD